MSDLVLKTFNKLYPMMIRKYSDLIIDQNASEKDKINSIILKLNALGKLSNDVVRDWNTVYQWTMNDGLTQDVNNKLEDMLAKGQLKSITDALVAEIGDLTTLTTPQKDTVVHSINSLQNEVTTNTAELAENVQKITLKKFPRLALELNDNGRLIRAFDYLKSYGGGLLDIIGETLSIARLSLNGIEIPSNIHINNYQTIYQMETNDQDRYGIFYIKGVQNVSINGGVFLGDRATHTVTQGTGGNGILVNGSLNVRLNNLVIKDFCGDGIGITDTNEFQGDNEVYLYNIYAENCKRQGISICNGKVVAENITCVGIGGAEPGAGIDIEPNNEDDLIDVYIRNLNTKNCTKGLLIFPSIFAGTSKKFNVTLNGHTDDGSGVGLLISYPIINGITAGFDGLIKLDQLSYSNNKEKAIDIVDWNELAPLIKLSNIDIKSSNANNVSNTPSIIIERLNTSYNYKIGNIVINGININSPLADYGVWVYDPNNQLGNINLDGISKIKAKTAEIRNDTAWLQNIGTQDLDSNSYFSKTLAKKSFVKNNGTSFTTLELLTVDMKGNEIEIINNTNSYITCVLPVGSLMYPTTIAGTTGINIMAYSRAKLTCDGTNFFVTSVLGTVNPRN